MAVRPLLWLVGHWGVAALQPAEANVNTLGPPGRGVRSPVPGQTFDLRMPGLTGGVRRSFVPYPVAES